MSIRLLLRSYFFISLFLLVSIAASARYLNAETSSATATSPSAQSESAADLLRRAIAYWRDTSSYTLAEMQVHRESWQRKSRIKSWTAGMDTSLVRFIAPAKDAGNATLKTDQDIWTYTPKTRRVIKIPASMKSQSWMGSDFSYQDLTQDEDVVKHYTHRFLEDESNDNHRLKVIESIPQEEAPVVWGKEVFKIRNDLIILEHLFYAQDGSLIKRMTSSKISVIGGKVYPEIVRMENVEKPNTWTELRHLEVKFGIEVPKNFYSLSNLQNPRG